MKRSDLEAFADNGNVKAFLFALRYGEGTADDRGYSRLVGGGEFEGFDRHPNRLIPITYTDSRTGKRTTINSTAAGAYQFLGRTWKGLVDRYGFADFSPRSQDLGGIGLIAGRGALADVVAGRIESAVRKCAAEWASLPNSPYGQPTKNMRQFLGYYERHGGTYGPIVTPTPAPPPSEPVEAPIEDSTGIPGTPQAGIWGQIPPIPIYEPGAYAPLFQPEKPAMAPFVAAALPILMQSVPSLIRIFGKGEQSQKNAETAERVIEIAKQVTGVDTAEGAVTRIQERADDRQAFEQALRTQWFDLYDPEIARANEESRKLASDRMTALMGSSRWNAVPWWGMAYLSLIGSFLLVKQILATATSEIQTLVLGSVLGVVSTVIAYFFGSSFRANSKVGDEQKS